jgi:hypothetical protein
MRMVCHAVIGGISGGHGVGINGGHGVTALP